MATATNPTVDELEKKEDELFRTGPLSVLTTSVKSNSQVPPLSPVTSFYWRQQERFPRHLPAAVHSVEVACIIEPTKFSRSDVPFHSLLAYGLTLDTLAGAHQL